MCSPRKSNENFSIFTFYESKQMSLTQDLRWSLGRSIALKLQRQTDLLLCTINCFLQWDHLPNMAVGDLAFYYTLYLWSRATWVFSEKQYVSGFNTTRSSTECFSLTKDHKYTREIPEPAPFSSRHGAQSQIGGLWVFSVIKIIVCHLHLLWSERENKHA